MVERLLTKREASDRLGISTATIDRLIQRGALPVVQASERAVRISEAALRLYIEARTERRGR